MQNLQVMHDATRIDNAGEFPCESQLRKYASSARHVINSAATRQPLNTSAGNEQNQPDVHARAMQTARSHDRCGSATARRCFSS